MEYVIRTNNLSKFIQSKPIVYRLNLDIPKGTLFGLLGPNGAGKSTTLKLLTGRIKPSSGSSEILGLNPWKDRVKLFQKVGYLPQNPTHHPEKTVLNFMLYMARLQGYGKSIALEKARNSLDSVGLGRFEDNIVGKLSGGEKQRLGLANALIGDPEILILDEPTASLDPEGRFYVMDLISNLARDRSRTIIVSSHILPEIQRMTNYIAIMSEGSILISGNMRELTKNVFDYQYEIETSHPEELKQLLEEIGLVVNLDEYVLIVNTNGNLNLLWDELPKLCYENNIQLKSCKPVRDALENVFLDLVSKQNRIRGVDI